MSTNEIDDLTAELIDLAGALWGSKGDAPAMTRIVIAHKSEEKKDTK